MPTFKLLLLSCGISLSIISFPCIALDKTHPGPDMGSFSCNYWSLALVNNTGGSVIITGVTTGGNAGPEEKYNGCSGTTLANGESCYVSLGGSSGGDDKNVNVKITTQNHGYVSMVLDNIGEDGCIATANGYLNQGCVVSQMSGSTESYNGACKCPGGQDPESQNSGGESGGSHPAMVGIICN